MSTQNALHLHRTYRHKLFIAALLLLYGAHPYVFPVEDPELVKTTRPLISPPLALSNGNVVRNAWTREKKLTSK